MKYISIPIALLRSAEYLGSEPVVRATWMNLLGYCADQENSGTIAACREWKDRQWQQTCGVTLEEVHNSQPLATWSADNLVVWQYPIEQERQLQQTIATRKRGGLAKTEEKAEAARRNGKRGGRPKLKATDAPPADPPSEDVPEGTGDSSPVLNLDILPIPKAEKPRKDKAALPDIIAFCQTEDLQRSDAEWFFHKCEGNGWTNGGHSIKDWKATIRAWKSRKIMPSQSGTVVNRPVKFTP